MRNSNSAELRLIQTLLYMSFKRVFHTPMASQFELFIKNHTVVCVLCFIINELASIFEMRLVITFILNNIDTHAQAQPLALQGRSQNEPLHQDY